MVVIMIMIMILNPSRSEATAMVSFYSVYLLIMYFNPRIEAWLYKITKTSSPEYKSDLHASNGNGNGKKQEKQGYEQVPSEDDAKKVQSGRPEDEKESREKDRDTFGMVPSEC